MDNIDASEFHNVKLDAKEMISPNLLTIPKTADGQLKFIGGDKVLCLLNLCYVVAQWSHRSLVTVDMTVTFLSSHRRLELKSDPRRKQFSSLCTVHFAPVLRFFPLLHGSGAGILGIGILIYSWYCGQLDELTAQMIEVRQQSSSTAMNAAVSGLAEADDGTVGVETASRGHESRKARAVRTWQRL